jgi:hypothetical protein
LIWGFSHGDNAIGGSGDTLSLAPTVEGGCDGGGNDPVSGINGMGGGLLILSRFLVIFYFSLEMDGRGNSRFQGLSGCIMII